MSFLLACPVCGPRDVTEFRYGGEVRVRPAPGAGTEAWADHIYARTNVAGVERAWWFHRSGCRRWFQAERDTRDDRLLGSRWAPGAGAGPRAGAEADG